MTDTPAPRWRTRLKVALAILAAILLAPVMVAMLLAGLSQERR